MIPIHNYISAKLRLRQSSGNWQIAKSRAVKAAFDHIKYLAHRPGPDREIGGRKFFDEEEDRIEGKDVRKWIKETYPGRNVVVHKLTIAPEINLEAEDEKPYVRAMMQELSNRLGQDLDWVAVQHKNTDNHHAHVLIGAKDKSGHDVKISLRDCQELKRASDEYLSREYPLVWELVVEPSREQRQQEKGFVKLQQEVTDDQRPKEPALPFLGAKRKAIVKELLMPYRQWKELNDEPEHVAGIERESIVYEGKKYTYATDIEKLKDLDRTLWERSPDQWLPKDQYNKLRSWVHRREEKPDWQPKYNYLEPSADPDKFSFEGKQYTKDSDRLAFRDLAKSLYNLNKEERETGDPITRLAPEDDNKFKYWKEDKDRQWGQEVVRDLRAAFYRDDDRPYISSKKKAILKELQCPYDEWKKEHTKPEPVDDEEVKTNEYRYKYLEPSTPDEDGFIFKYGNYKKEFTKESLRFEFNDLAKTLYEINRQERDNNQPLTRLSRQDDAKFKFWKEVKDRQWGKKLVERLQSRNIDLPTAEDQQLDMQDRTTGAAGGGPVGATILQDDKPGNPQATAKLIELPKDELDEIDKYLEELSQSKYQDWLSRHGVDKAKERLSDDRAIDGIEQTRQSVQKIKSARERAEEKERRMRQALILGLEAYEIGQQRLEDELER